MNTCIVTWEEKHQCTVFADNASEAEDKMYANDYSSEQTFKEFTSVIVEEEEQ